MTDVAAKPSDELHPAYKVVQAIESTWSRDRAQEWQRTQLVVRALAEAGLLVGGELKGGKFYCRSGIEGTPSSA